MKKLLWTAFVGLMASGAACAADLAFLKELVEIPSSSIDYPQVNRAMRAMKAYLEKRGLFCTVETDDKGRELLFAATKPGKDSFLIPRPSVTSVIYYKSRSIQNSDIINGGKLKAPPQTYIYPNTQSCWLCQPSGVAEASDDLMAVTTTYVYAEEGWDTDIYELAT